MILRRLLAFAVCAAIGVASAAPPSSVKADYNLFRDGLHIAVVQETYAKTGTQYQIVSNTKAVGLALLLFKRAKIKVQSEGTVTSGGLQPERFEYGLINDPGNNVSATFDWRAHELHMTFDGSDKTIPLAPGTQDRISVMYQFMFLPRNRLKLLEFAFTNGKKIEPYRYELAGNEQLDTPLGKLNTLHLVKHRDPGENGAEVWLAADRNMFPVKLLILENDGSKFEQVITRLDMK